MNIRRKLKAHTEIHTGPLNDILFILLLFFLIAATLANPNLMPVHLPKAKSESNAKQNVIVTIDANQQYYVGGKKVELHQIRDEILPIIQKDTAAATIVINMDSTVAMYKGFEIVRLAQQMGVKSSFSVKGN